MGGIAPRPATKDPAAVSGGRPPRSSRGLVRGNVPRFPRVPQQRPPRPSAAGVPHGRPAASIAATSPTFRGSSAAVVPATFTTAAGRPSTAVPRPRSRRAATAAFPPAAVHGIVCCDIPGGHPRVLVRGGVCPRPSAVGRHRPQSSTPHGTPSCGDVPRRDPRSSNDQRACVPRTKDATHRATERERAPHIAADEGGNRSPFVRAFV